MFYTLAGAFVVRGRLTLKTITRRREGFFLIDAVGILGTFLLPPLAVYLTVGFRGQFWLSLLLTLLGFLPGMVHAIWLLTAHGGVS
jgi:uncharacterized membrane protein YqaE (UPF0057 family)